MANIKYLGWNVWLQKTQTCISRTLTLRKILIHSTLRSMVRILHVWLLFTYTVHLNFLALSAVWSSWRIYSMDKKANFAESCPIFTQIVSYREELYDDIIIIIYMYKHKQHKHMYKCIWNVNYRCIIMDCQNIRCSRITKWTIIMQITYIWARNKLAF